LRTIAILNQKGGVGKTTTAVNTAAALANFGLNVVVVDLDPQAHMTIHLGVEPETVQTSGYEVLTQSADFERSLMLVRHHLWLLPANIHLVGAETELVSMVGREIILREALHASQAHFDYCIIDCAPSLGLLSLNALAAADEVLIPLQPHFLALQGFGKLLQTVDLVNRRINPNLKVSGVLLCMFDTRASLPGEVRADIEAFLQGARGSTNAWAEAEVYPTFIRRNIKLAEAPSYGKTIFEYDPTCNGAEDYKKVARHLLGLDPEPNEEPVEPTEGEDMQAEGLSAADPPPIKIREVNLPVPRCYAPKPLWDFDGRPAAGPSEGDESNAEV
jgi:chromosome partitioning protein